MACVLPHPSSNMNPSYTPYAPSSAPLPPSSTAGSQSLGFFSSAFNSAPPPRPPSYFPQPAQPPAYMPPPSSSMAAPAAAGAPSQHGRGGRGGFPRGGRRGRGGKEHQQQHHQQHLRPQHPPFKTRGGGRRGPHQQHTQGRGGGRHFHHHGKNKNKQGKRGWCKTPCCPRTPRTLALTAPLLHTVVHASNSAAPRTPHCCRNTTVPQLYSSFSPLPFHHEDRTPRITDAPNAPDNSTQSFLAPGTCACAYCERGHKRVQSISL